MKTQTYASIAELRPYLIRAGMKARLLNGERATLAVIDIEPNGVAEEHHHENEQLGLIVAGVLTLRIAGHLRDSRQRPARRQGGSVGRDRRRRVHPGARGLGEATSRGAVGAGLALFLEVEKARASRPRNGEAVSPSVPCPGLPRAA